MKEQQSCSFWAVIEEVWHFDVCVVIVFPAGTKDM